MVRKKVYEISFNVEWKIAFHIEKGLHGRVHETDSFGVNKAQNSDWEYVRTYLCILNINKC